MILSIGISFGACKGCLTSSKHICGDLGWKGWLLFFKRVMLLIFFNLPNNVDLNALLSLNQTFVHRSQTRVNAAEREKKTTLDDVNISAVNSRHRDTLRVMGLATESQLGKASECGTSLSNPLSR